MKLKVKFAKAAFLVTLLTGFVMTFAGEALAAKNPNWVGISRRPVTIVRNTDQSIPITAPNYWLLRIPIGHTNNSQDRDITSIYDVQVRFHAVMNRNITGASPRSGAAVSRTGNFSRVQNYTDFWPGRTRDRDYFIPIGDLIRGGDNTARRWINEAIRDTRGNEQQRAAAFFRDMRVGYDFHVRSSRSD